MNILVTGANGQLGSEMRIVSANSAHDTYIFTDINEVEGVETINLDITDIDAIRSIVNANNVKCIVNCAAYTNVDGAEDCIEICRKLNADAPRNLAIVMKEVDGLLVHISTDYVFGADPYNTPCKETQNGTPSGVYGLTKLEGEKAIIESGCQHIIIRTAWLYSEFGKNFVKTMLRLGKEREELGVIFDQIGTPTYARDLAEAIMTAVDKGVRPGVYHFTDEGVCSWYDFTRAIHELAGLSDKCHVRPLHTEEYPTPAARPHYSVLDKTKIKQTYGIEIPWWKDSLKKCLKELL